MKTILIFLLSLSVAASLAQNRTVNVGNAEIEERMKREGDILSTGAITKNTLWTGQAANTGGQIVVQTTIPLSFAMYIRSITFSASRAVEVRGVYGSYNLGNYPGQNTPLALSPGVPATLYYGATVKAGQEMPNLRVTSVIDADPTVSMATATNGGQYLTTAKSFITVLTSPRYSYSITATNTTGSSLTGTTTVTDILPAGCRFVAGSGTGWTVSESSGTITATSTTTLANNAVTAAVSVTVAPTITTSFAMAVAGYMIDSDDDYSAPNIMPICGTSISAGSGASSSLTIWNWQFRNWLRESYGYRVRRVNRAVSGTNSSHHEQLRSGSGRYDFEGKTGIFIYEQGANENGGGVSVATSQANLLAMIQHKQRMYPAMTMLVLSPFTNRNSTTEATLVTLRTALASTVSGVNDPKVKFVTGTGSCLNTATDFSDDVHPNDSGHGKIFQAVRDFITTNNIQF